RRLQTRRGSDLVAARTRHRDLRQRSGEREPVSRRASRLRLRLPRHATRAGPAAALPEDQGHRYIRARLMRYERGSARATALLFLAAIVFETACDAAQSATTPPATDAGTSPNASILPAPLASEAPELDAGIAHREAAPLGIAADSA